MTSAEMSSEVFQEAPICFGIKFVRCTATSTNNTDYITFTPKLTLVKGIVSVYATDGTAGTCTIAGTDTVLTFSNGSTKTWEAVVWGV